MKTSQKEDVSDRPPTPVTCPDVRHRSSTAAVDVGSAQIHAVHTSSDTRAAPIPLPRPRCAHAISVDLGPGEQRFPKLSIIVTASVDAPETAVAQGDADRLRARSADSRMTISPGHGWCACARPIGSRRWSAWSGSGRLPAQPANAS